MRDSVLNTPAAEGTVGGLGSGVKSGQLAASSSTSVTSAYKHPHYENGKHSLSSLAQHREKEALDQHLQFPILPHSSTASISVPSHASSLFDPRISLFIPISQIKLGTSYRAGTMVMVE